MPSVTKATLMERFDDVITDREVHLAEVEVHLARATATDRFRGRYRVAATGGTTGRRGIFLADPDEWSTILASYARANDWAGIPAGLTHRLRVAVVSSRNPTHQSSIVGATLRSRFVPTLRLDATDPMEEIVVALNAFRPDSLVGYASILRLLADEQLAGRLALAPQAVMSASEVLTDETRARIRSALVIAEVVDSDNQPVPTGEFGAKLLVTVLFSRTQPLIRYELSDRIRASDGTCPDGRPFGLFDGIEGREEDLLSLAGLDGRPVTIHPHVFHAVLDSLPLAGWQVIEEVDGLRVLIATTSDAVIAADVQALVEDALRSAGVAPQRVAVQRVAAIPRTSLGKAPLVHRRAATG